MSATTLEESREAFRSAVLDEHATAQGILWLAALHVRMLTAREEAEHCHALALTVLEALAELGRLEGATQRMLGVVDALAWWIDPDALSTGFAWWVAARVGRR